MPRHHNTKAKDVEHLIFVKNVPAHVADGPLLDLFARYEPTRVKNVYPTSDITTVVFSFPTSDEACFAKEDTDGIRLENVVLRVESFDKFRSVRYLRDERNANRPLGAVDDNDYYEEEVKSPPNYSLELEGTTLIRPSAPLQQSNGTSTWAQIARNTNPLGMAPLPAPQVASLHPATGKENGSPTQAAEATLRSPTGPDTSDTLSDSAVIDNTSLEALSMTSTGDADDEDDDAVWKGQSHPSRNKLVPGHVRVALAAPIDSTDTIRNRHCSDCIFCQMRALSRS